MVLGEGKIHVGTWVRRSERRPWACLVALKDYFILYNKSFISNICPNITPNPLSPALCPGSLTYLHFTKALPSWLPVGSRNEAHWRSERRKRKVNLPSVVISAATPLAEGHNSYQVALSMPFSISLDSVKCPLLLSCTHKGKNNQLLIVPGYCFLHVISIQPTQSFINELFIQFFSNHLVWIRHLFLSGTLTDIYSVSLAKE